MTEARTPVVFIHGLWLHASSWQPWVDLFNDSGYDADAVADHGIDEIAEHYATYMATLPSRRIVIGHSFGGLLAEKLLGDGQAIAGVGIDATPIKGVLPLPISALRVAFVALKNPGNIDAAVSLTKEQFRYGFGNAISDDESDELFDKWPIPSPGRPLFQAATANFNPHAQTKVDT
jgi:pimeloyl-ACP methyl ester carboxylesterase